MITIAASELEFYQKKIYRLEMETITLQEQLYKFRSNNSDQYKIKYELLLAKIAEETTLKESKRNQTFLQQEKQLNDNNQKWQALLAEKTSQFKTQLQAINLEKSSLRNRVVELEMKIIRLQRDLDEGDVEIMKIKVESLKKENDRLRKQNNDLYTSREYALDDLKREGEAKVEAAKERQKSFYRDQISSLEKQIEQMEQVLESERQKISPQRQKLILNLQQQITRLKLSHEKQIQDLTVLLEKRNKQYLNFKETTDKKQAANYELISHLTDQVKTLEGRLFQSDFDRQIELKQSLDDASSKRQKEAEDFKQYLDKLNSQFDRQRNEWKSLIDQAQNNGNLLKKQVQQQKQKFIEEKKALKSKIAQLKMRLKEREEDRGNGETQLLIKSLKQLNNNQQNFSSYENAITFYDRQIRKAAIKLEQKNREINHLLQQLHLLQEETQVQVRQTKAKCQQENRKLYDRVFKLEDEIDTLQQQIKEKDKLIKKKQLQQKDEQTGHQSQVQNLKKIIQEMERDYKRLTGNKKNLEDSYREERQNVISGKLDINQEKKKKWVELMRQKNELQIVYREREMQIKGEYQTLIDKLRRQKQQCVEQREEYRAEIQLLRQRLEDSEEDNKQNRSTQYQKKLATLDLQIALTQNLFNTLSSATSKHPQKSQVLQEMSEGQSSKLGSSQSFQIKVSAAGTPPFSSEDYQREDIYKGATFSFSPYGLGK